MMSSRWMSRSVISPLILFLLALGLVGSGGIAQATERTVVGEVFSQDG